MEYTNFSEDKLNRKMVAINLMNVIKYNPNLKVLAIDSGWGTGKTTFINMWIDMINNEKDENEKCKYKDEYETMYFNAWENDFINEPIVSLLSELEKQMSEKDSHIKNILIKGKDKIKPFLQVGGKIGLKYLTQGVLDNVTWSELTEEGVQELSNKIGDLVFKEVEVAKKSRKALKEDLVKFQNNINKKVIIFIDELDRCRPTYAIELLETIKHIFNIENFIFVISLDKLQLSESIKTIYGQNMDSNGYLRRFFDLEYQLQLNQELKQYVKFISEDLDNKFSNILFFKRFMEEIFYQEHYSLRDINKAFNYIKLVLPTIEEFTTTKKFKDSYMLLVSYLYMAFLNLKIKHSEKLEVIINGAYTDDLKYISEELITIDKNSMNLKFENHFDDIRAKEMIENALEKYILLIKDQQRFGKESYEFYKQDFKEDRYEVGIKKEDGTYFYDAHFKLDSLKLDIIDKINFANNIEFQ